MNGAAGRRTRWTTATDIVAFEAHDIGVVVAADDALAGADAQNDADHYTDALALVQALVAAQDQLQSHEYQVADVASVEIDGLPAALPGIVESIGFREADDCNAAPAFARPHH